MELQLILIKIVKLQRFSRQKVHNIVGAVMTTTMMMMAQ